MVSGVVFLNKSAGKTSFSSLSAVKKILNTRKVGHTGTLDSFAEGLMIVVVGKMTKLVKILSDKDKCYTATIKFGIETDTLDPTGKIVAEGFIPSLEDIEETLDNFRGNIEQIPPKYSAIHINGKRAYQLTNEGKDFDIPSRSITIYSLDVISYIDGELKINVKCSKGTYIRSLARDIARSINTYGHLVKLIRTTVGQFDLSKSFKEDELSEESLISPKEFLSELNGVQLFEIKEDSAIYVKQGRPISTIQGIILSDFTSRYVAITQKNEVLALLENGNHGEWKYLFVNN